MPAAAEAFSTDTRQRLDAYVHLLRRWNRTINLVAAPDLAVLWQRHILDCAQLARLLPEQPGRLIDLGSGAGFPGLVLALTTGWDVHLVEADHRKAAFLREAVRETGAHASVHAERAEFVKLAPAPVVTARALATTATLLALASRLLAPGGLCLFPKGQSAEDELTHAATQWHMRVERFPSQTSTGATLLRISEIRRAPSTA